MEFLDRIRLLAAKRHRGHYLGEVLKRGICSLQHDFDIANASGAVVRGDLNDALEALATVSSGTSGPSTTYAYQLWADTTNALLKQRNAANSGWVVRGSLTEAPVVARSSNTILGVGDFGKWFTFTSTFTQTLTAAATLGAGWFVAVRNAGTGVITLDPNSSETIDGATTLEIYPGESLYVVCDGSNFFTYGRTPTGLINFTPTLTFGGAAVGMTFGTQVGRALKIGGAVEFYINLNLTAKGSSTGAALLGGLPFTALNLATVNVPCPVFADSMNAAVTTSLIALVANNSTTILPFKYAAGVATQLDDTSFTDTSSFVVSGRYFT